MTFDKNQRDFPSKEHNAVWSLGIHVLPLEITLPPQVRDSLPPYLAESCVQLRAFLLGLLGDMYENIEAYLPLPYQLSRKILRPLIDFALMGEAEESRLIINRQAFDKFIKRLKNSVDYEDDRKAKIGIENRLKLLERNGLKFEYTGSDVILTNPMYPDMFYAMRETALLTADEKQSMDNSFTYCDFRRLCKSYKYDKYENALGFLNDGQRELARKIDAAAKGLKLTRSVSGGHCPGYGVEYKYKKQSVMDLNCMSRMYVHKPRGGLNNYQSNDMILYIHIPYDINDPSPVHEMLDAVERDSPELKEFIYRRLRRCLMCYEGCYAHGGINGRYIKFYGKTNKICLRHVKGSMYSLDVGNYFPFSPDDAPMICKTLIYVMKAHDLTAAKNNTREHE